MKPLPVRKLLVVNLYYAPDVASTGQLAADICESLAGEGIEVHVVAAQPCYTAGAAAAPAYELRNGVHVHRVSLGGTRGRERMSTRVSGYLRFLWGAWRMAGSLVRSERPDGVMTFHNPPFVGLIGARLARRHRLHYTYALYDIHPDVLIATRWCRLPAPLIWAWRGLNRWIIGGAGAVIVLGEGMRRTLVEEWRVPPEKVRVIPIWARPELSPASRPADIRAELGVGPADLLLLHAGNMGIMHPVEPIVEAAERLSERPVTFLFLGDGAKRAALEARAREARLTRVKFLPFQSEEKFARLLAAADACFVALSPGLEAFAVPSRAYTMLSAGRPLITLMAPGADIARLVEEAECGWNVAGAAELVELVEHLIADPAELARRGERGRRIYESRYRRDRVISRYLEVLTPAS